MKYEMTVQIYLRPEGHSEFGNNSTLELHENLLIELASFSKSAEAIVKLHDFFEEVRKFGGL
jgi:hypothetical protein